MTFLYKRALASKIEEVVSESLNNFPNKTLPLGLTPLTAVLAPLNYTLQVKVFLVLGLMSDFDITLHMFRYYVLKL